jgi:hypothetical protein
MVDMAHEKCGFANSENWKIMNKHVKYNNRKNSLAVQQQLTLEARKDS